MTFESTNPDARNCQVVRELNKLIISGLRPDEYQRAVKLRDRTMALQRTPFADSGLPFHAAVEYLVAKLGPSYQNVTR